MISKKILLVLICFITLLATVGVYSYTEISRLKNQVDSMNSQRTFTFCWGGPIAEKFNVSTFWMNVTFERTNETHLTITAKVNDLGYSVCVSIVFDVNHNGKIDRDDYGWQYFRAKYYCDPYYAKRLGSLGDYDDSQRFITSFAQCYDASEHTVFFDAEKGYTYIIPVNMMDVFVEYEYMEKTEVINDLIHVEYWGNVKEGKFNKVSVEFCFGMELIT